MPSNDFYADLPDTEPTGGSRSDLIPAGEYKMQITKVEHFVSPSKDTPGYTYTFKVVGGEYDGSTIQHTYWVTQAAIGILQGFLRSCGVTYKGKGVNVRNAVGKQVLARVKIRKGDKGGEFSEIHYTNPIGGAQPSSTPEPRDEDVPPAKAGKW